MENKLNIVNEEGNIIGEETRERIHKEGLLHKEVHVLFYTPDNQIIFQHRAKDKDTYPNLLDATVGGHVEIGSDYLGSVVKEAKEETGIDININDLQFLTILRNKTQDDVTKKINNVLRAVYEYRYTGKAEDLRIEKGKSLGFEQWPIDKLTTLNNEESKKFIPSVLEEILEIYRKIGKLK